MFIVRIINLNKVILKTSSAMRRETSANTARLASPNWKCLRFVQCASLLSLNLRQGVRKIFLMDPYHPNSESDPDPVGQLIADASGSDLATLVRKICCQKANIANNLLIYISM